jgi:hypothetical protein
MAAKCHFAHGKGELRGMNDPLPPNANTVSNTPKQSQNFSGHSEHQKHSGHSNTSGPTNFKTARCKYFEKGKEASHMEMANFDLRYFN